MWNRIEFAALAYITVPTPAFIGDRELRALALSLGEQHTCHASSLISAPLKLNGRHARNATDR
jgi:hypothetical protein